MKLRLRPGRKLPGRSFLWLPLLNEEGLWGTDRHTSTATLACNAPLLRSTCVRSGYDAGMISHIKFNNIGKKILISLDNCGELCYT